MGEKREREVGKGGLWLEMKPAAVAGLQRRHTRKAQRTLVCRCRPPLEKPQPQALRIVHLFVVLAG